jgi:hypothetical protein
MEPEVRYLLLCDDVRTDPDNYHRLNIFGLITSIRSTADPPFPVVRPLLCAVVLLAGADRSGELRLRIVQSSSGRVIFRSPPRQVRLVGDPQAVRGAVFRIRNCSFPSAGLYWLEVLFEQTIIGRQKFQLSA